MIDFYEIIQKAHDHKACGYGKRKINFAAVEAKRTKSDDNNSANKGKPAHSGRAAFIFVLFNVTQDILPSF